jgi:hypothetical protein
VILRILTLHCGFCLLAFCLVESRALAVTPPPPQARVFWVRNGGEGSGLASFRKASASLRASGIRSAIYVEDKVAAPGLTPEYLARLESQLEHAAPNGAYLLNEGLISLEELLFGPLPRTYGDSLVLLFTDLGSLTLDGDIHDFDQLTDADAVARLATHSNEGNVIYVNGFRKTEARTGGEVARELQRLTNVGPSGVRREPWLMDALGEGAMLLGGYFADQDRVDDYLHHSGKYPLVTTNGAQLGPQLLFSSFLLDSLPSAHGTAVGALSRLSLGGRDAVEKLYQDLTQSPLNFDAIFSNFVSYVFDRSAASTALPSSWHHNSAIRAQSIAPYFTYKAGSGELSGELAPYSFVAVDLAQELSPTAEIHVSRAAAPAEAVPSDCAQNASILWKPVNKTRIAVYALGCDPSSPVEMVQFRLKILDQPSLSHRAPLKLFR